VFSLHRNGGTQIDEKPSGRKEYISDTLHSRPKLMLTYKFSVLNLWSQFALSGRKLVFWQLGMYPLPLKGVLGSPIKAEAEDAIVFIRSGNVSSICAHKMCPWKVSYVARLSTRPILDEDVPIL
jgi:hypothetical protein